jgi:hypothetical protein
VGYKHFAPLERRQAAPSHQAAKPKARSLVSLIGLNFLKTDPRDSLPEEKGRPIQIESAARFLDQTLALYCWSLIPPIP